MQDLALKFFEAMNAVAGASLESSTWFRRNVAVLPNVDTTENEGGGHVSGHVPSSAASTPLQARNSQYSASALCFMAEVLFTSPIFFFAPPIYVRLLLYCLV